MQLEDFDLELSWRCSTLTHSTFRPLFWFGCELSHLGLFLGEEPLYNFDFSTQSLLPLLVLKQSLPAFVTTDPLLSPPPLATVATLVFSGMFSDPNPNPDWFLKRKMFNNSEFLRSSRMPRLANSSKSRKSNKRLCNLKKKDEDMRIRLAWGVLGGYEQPFVLCLH